MVNKKKKDNVFEMHSGKINVKKNDKIIGVGLIFYAYCFFLIKIILLQIIKTVYFEGSPFVLFKALKVHET